MNLQVANKPAQEGDPSVKEYLAGVKVVDADTHITEWPDLWLSRATPKYRDRVPQIREVNGKRAWFIDDYELAPDSGFSAIKRDGSKVFGLDFFNLRFDDVYQGSHEVKARVAYMDEVGIAGQIGYPNLLGFGGGKSMQVDPDLRFVSMQIQNDAMAQMQRESNNRIYPMAMIPWWDIKQAVAEAERCADMGLRGINTHASPHERGLPDLGDHHWTPLWELCEDRGLPVNFHIGFSQGDEGWMPPNSWKSHSDSINYSVGGSMLFAGNMLAVVNILLSDIFQRHPRLKMVSVESGLGWVPFMLEMMNYQMTETVFNSPREELLETFRKHIYVCAWSEREGIVDFVNRIGPDNVMFETDFPHPTCLYPGPLEYHIPTFKVLSAENRGKVFGRNAEALYNLDLSAAR